MPDPKATPTEISIPSFLKIIRLIISLCLCLFYDVILNFNSSSCFVFFRTRAPYGEKKEKFVYALSLVFVQCIVNALFAEAGKLIRDNLLENNLPQCKNYFPKLFENREKNYLVEANLVYNNSKIVGNAVTQ